ncbi:hypothetical protein HYH03_002705 [Edaphochlamys debaryana]|uniref:Uncharacterized protein n=1 Tax=Edaphochlamys debaryana TaxID=47281 RepID=A0A836C4V7_9CHLO|nr:hypothetical protein HYH03_002705 [Edaphochlamys debaryana]|eukprot:KAG2499122.1 hypothetical protein HYH03_002705 [Edaphochlamys debaryana]
MHLARLCSNASAGCSSASALAPAACAALQARGLAGFTKANIKGAVTTNKKGGARDGPDESNPRLSPVVTLLSPPPRQAVPLTPEQQAAVAEHEATTFAEHQAWVRDMAVKFQLQKAALHALPEPLRQMATQPDTSPLPLNRKYLFDTPPEAYRDVAAKPEAAGGEAAGAAASDKAGGPGAAGGKAGKQGGGDKAGRQGGSGGR